MREDGIAPVALGGLLGLLVGVAVDVAWLGWSGWGVFGGAALGTAAGMGIARRS